MGSNTNTDIQYKAQVQVCRDLFVKKAHDYGTAWRVLRPSSLTDQIFIKANRIRSIETKGTRKVDDDVRTEYIGIINYCAMALIQCGMDFSISSDLPIEEAIRLYDGQINRAFELMKAKNHDYDEAWRMMRISSMTDLVLMKLMRTKEIEDNNGDTLVSEGVDANYLDMINYSFFALILLQEQQDKAQ